MLPSLLGKIDTAKQIKKKKISLCSLRQWKETLVSHVANLEAPPQKGSLPYPEFKTVPKSITRGIKEATAIASCEGTRVT